jgi:hypothetical protein
MQTLFDGAMLMEAVLVSLLLGLWVTWLGLRGLFRLLPAGRAEVVPVRLVANRNGAARSRSAA